VGGARDRHTEQALADAGPGGILRATACGVDPAPGGGAQFGQQAVAVRLDARQAFQQAVQEFGVVRAWGEAWRKRGSLAGALAGARQGR
jgi:hypothetical protein